MTADAAPSRTIDPAGASQALDADVLERLRIELEDEDGTAVASLVSIYLDSAQTLIPDLVGALRSGDAAAAASFAHALASPSALIGAIRMGTLLQRVQDETADARVHAAELAVLAETIGREGDQVVAALALMEPAVVAGSDPPT
jgi:HPt (histidine-containing phosphotransfer) domain-containing protein